MDILIGLLGIRRMDRVPNSQIRELSRIMKGVDERNNGGVLQWFSHMERIKNDRIAKKVYVLVCAGSCSMGRPQKRWIDTMKDWMLFQCMIYHKFLIYPMIYH